MREGGRFADEIWRLPEAFYTPQTPWLTLWSFPYSAKIGHSICPRHRRDRWGPSQPGVEGCARSGWWLATTRLDAFFNASPALCATSRLSSPLSSSTSRRQSLLLRSHFASEMLSRTMEYHQYQTRATQIRIPCTFQVQRMKIKNEAMYITVHTHSNESKSPSQRTEQL